MKTIWCSSLLSLSLLLTFACKKEGGDTNEEAVPVSERVYATKINLVQLESSGANHEQTALLPDRVLWETRQHGIDFAIDLFEAELGRDGRWTTTSTTRIEGRNGFSYIELSEGILQFLTDSNGGALEVTYYAADGTSTQVDLCSGNQTWCYPVFHSPTPAGLLMVDLYPPLKGDPYYLRWLGEGSAIASEITAVPTGAKGELIGVTSTGRTVFGAYLLRGLPGQGQAVLRAFQFMANDPVTTYTVLSEAQIPASFSGSSGIGIADGSSYAICLAGQSPVILRWNLSSPSAAPTVERLDGAFGQLSPWVMASQSANHVARLRGQGLIGTTEGQQQFYRFDGKGLEALWDQRFYTIQLPGDQLPLKREFEGEYPFRLRIFQERNGLLYLHNNTLIVAIDPTSRAIEKAWTIVNSRDQVVTDSTAIMNAQIKDDELQIVVIDNLYQNTSKVSVGTAKL